MTGSNSRPLGVVVGCDTDPDRLDFGGIAFNAGARPQVWEGVGCISTLRDRLDRITDLDGRPVAVSWFLRCDEQMRVTEGSYAHPISAFGALWKRCLSSGDEIGWHPHLWRLSGDGLTWFHEVEDVQFQVDMLQRAHDAFEQAWGKAPTSVRMGWDFHNNHTIAQLAALGIRIDLSALPYQRFAGARNDRGASFAGYFDWSTTGTLPYRPSKVDYRRPGVGEDALDIFELPQGLLRSRLAGVLSEGRGALRERSPARLVRSIRSGSAVANLTVKACSPPFLFRAMVRDILRRNEDWVVTHFHPDELLPDKRQFVNNLIHRASYLEQNMRTILLEADRAGRAVKFLTASAAGASLQA
jgi:hypothetical protein